ncbi:MULTISPECIES: MnmC family methyltransferase [unclassified Prochlorococcus]|uniref:MnmC family methyltransferase n=1 Tax=unclassified Prochlorococcus TaxID=2627481 RepID=UPI000533A6C9|nr:MULTISPECIES: MnmC family methyltransferase [unclassified Prochlorococcus]KGG15374.1 SAM-dependent methyltransferase [Prochlorococcus sp. MIT 0602]
MKDLEVNLSQIPDSSDDLTMHQTEDGSISLNSKFFNESFHNSSGAIMEAKEKFLNPSEIELHARDTMVFALDICVGMGYNTALLIESIIANKLSLNWWGLEIDKRPIKIALKNPTFTSQWNHEIIKCLQMILKTNAWNNSFSKGKMLWGDARVRLNEIPEEIKFDLIYLDAFSPQHCPELWSEEFLASLSKRLSKKGKLITYSRAAAVRSSLRRAGLEIKSLMPKKEAYNEWSRGTIGINTKNNEIQKDKKALWQCLSKMEEEHLKTHAAVPYRDPTGQSSSNEILTKRIYEQSNSNLKSTSLWRKEWLRTNK